MADNIELNAGAGGATMRTLEDASGNQWVPAVVAYATTVGDPDVLQFATSAAGLPVAQQGTWTVTANAGTGTFAISASSLPLPDGAATSDKQPSLGTAGTPSADVITIQGVASMTAVKTDGSGVTQPVSGTVTIQDGGGSITVDNGGTFAVQAAQSGNWLVRNQDGAGNALTSKSVGSERAISVAIVDGSGAQVTSFGGSGGTASNFGSTFPASGTAIGVIDDAGDMAGLTLDSSGNLLVNVAAGGGSGGTSSSFGSATPSTGTAVGFSDGTNMRPGLAFDLDTGGGTEYVLGVGIRLSGPGGSAEGGTSGNPLRVDPTGSTAQPVTAVSLPLPTGASTAAKQPALGTAGTASSDVITVQGIASMTPLDVSAVQSGDWTVQPGNTANTTPWLFTVSQGGNSATVTGSNALKVDGSAVTQPASLASLPALVAGTALIGKVSASHETDAIYSGATALTPKFAAISASSSGSTQVVAAVSGKKIRVLRWSASSNGSVNIKWKRASTDITGLYYMTQYKDSGGGYCPVGHFETAATEALNVDLSAAVAVGGVLTYVEV